MSDTTVAQQLFITNYVHLTSITILYYDHLITLGPEIRLLWGRRRSLSAYWFYLNRYFGFFSSIPVATLPFLTVSNDVQHLYVSLYLPGARSHDNAKIASMIMLIRVYALYRRSRRVLFFLIGIGCGVVAASLVLFNLGREGLSTSGVGRVPFWVIQVDRISAYTSRRQMALAYANDDDEQNYSPPLSNLHHLMVRDGAMYFGIMALANLANIATYYFSGPIVPGSLVIFASCISITMISRMMLNLHAHAMSTGIINESLAGRPNFRHRPVALQSMPALPLAFADPEHISPRDPTTAGNGAII
ncbi:hypothetical protein B0H16DRAFT_1763383 [Mycena metata]|uniref:DUF6533 domain-containing protein n=1 Tax=Mycena metata TaxID=1033252 RepID=A0AAD7JXN8_9AGAR|nr:hypothetical protein B0H16DRAFT_1763383 [Mycena metata]